VATIKVATKAARITAITSRTLKAALEAVARAVPSRITKVDRLQVAVARLARRSPAMIRGGMTVRFKEMEHCKAAVRSQEIRAMIPMRFRGMVLSAAVVHCRALVRFRAPVPFKERVLFKARGHCSGPVRFKAPARFSAPVRCKARGRYLVPVRFKGPVLSLVPVRYRALRL
jgi:hypothetical protein